MAPAEGDVYAPLWSSRLAKSAGVTRLLRRVGRPEFGPYAYVSLLLFIDTGVLSTIGYVVADRRHPLLEDPFWYAAPVGLWFAIWSARWLVRGYHGIVTSYDIDRCFAAPTVTADSIYDIRRTRLKHGVFLALLALHAVNYLVLGGWAEVVDVAGPVIGSLKFGVIIPFGYFPIIAEFAGLVLASLVVVPRYVVDNGYQLQFDDPLDTGGLEPVGDLIKQSAYIYAFGLVFALVFEYGSATYAEFGTGATPPIALKTTEFAAVWGLGVALLLYATFTLHSYMQRQKRRKIEELDARLRELGNDDLGFPETDPDEGDYPRLELEYLRLQKVKDTSTLPFTAATEERVLVSALFPIALEVGINVLL